MERKIPVGVSVPKKTLDAIDETRGQIPRSIWVVDAVEARLKHLGRKGSSSK